MIVAVIFAIVGVALIAYEIEKRNSATQNQCSGCGCVSGCCCGGGAVNICCAITFDPQTWPSGDRYWLIAHAIAFTEGANREGSNPDKLNNPGDISDAFSLYGGETHSGSNVTHFPDKATGWRWLHTKLVEIGARQSSVYSPDMTWNEIAQKWAGDWKAWVTNVTVILGVAPESTFGDYING